jgi:hypothetical protein
LIDDLQLSTSLDSNLSAVIDHDTSIAQNILNKHYQPVFHCSAMIWPIVRPNPVDEPQTHRSVLGFLCVDTVSTNVFSGPRDEAIGWLYTALISFLLLAMFDLRRADPNGGTHS